MMIDSPSSSMLYCDSSSCSSFHHPLIAALKSLFVTSIALSLVLYFPVSRTVQAAFRRFRSRSCGGVQLVPGVGASLVDVRWRQGAILYVVS